MKEFYRCNCMMNQCDGDYCYAETTYNPYASTSSGEPPFFLTKGTQRFGVVHRTDPHRVGILLLFLKSFLMLG